MSDVRRISAIEFIEYAQVHFCKQRECEHTHLLEDSDFEECGVRIPAICCDECLIPYMDHVREMEKK